MKNVFMVNLSTFSKKKDDEYPILKENEFKYDDDTKSVKGKYQLDPIPYMMSQKGKRIDYAILFETEATKKNVTIIDVVDGEEIKKDISPSDYFKEHLTSIFEDLNEDDRIKEIPIKENGIAESIKETLGFIKDLSGKDIINLYVDTHGGFRSTQLVQEAILQLHFNDKIKAVFYNVQFGNHNEPNRIVKDEAHRIFDFVSGIKEFDYTGRIDSLRDYLDEKFEYNKTFLEPIYAISEGIQWCNIVDFETGLRELKEYYSKGNKISDPYLGLFEEYIHADYGELLSEKAKAIDMVEWCVNKGFYQQALTIIESKMPETFFEDEIFSLTKEGENYKENNKERDYEKKLSFHSIFTNSLKNFVAYPRRNPINWYKFMTKAGRVSDQDIQNHIKKSINDNNKINKSDYISGERVDYKALIKTIYQCKISDFAGKEKICNNAISVKSEREKEICMLVYTHLCIKRVRNKANHGATDGKFNTQNVKAAIIYYIDLYRRVIR